MSKLICALCGTEYLETAPCCPICGWKHTKGMDTDSDNFDIEFLDELDLSSDAEEPASEDTPKTETEEPARENSADDPDDAGEEKAQPEELDAEPDADAAGDEELMDLAGILDGDLSDIPGLDFDLSGFDLDDEPTEPAPKKAKAVFDYDAVNNIGQNPKAKAKSAASGPSKPKAKPKAAPVPAPKQKPKPAPQPKKKPAEEMPDFDEELEEEESGSSTFLIVLLVILIVALLLTSGYIFWRYYLPGMKAQETIPTTVETVMESEETTEETIPTIPCTGLSLVSSPEKFTFEGQNWLLHVKATPEDTTDIITFVSSDENVVTVNEEGRVTVVAEGDAKIIITCGAKKIECPVSVSYEEETTEPETTAAETETVEETEAATEQTQPAPSDVVLKLKRQDITLGRRGVYYTLELDCELNAEDVEWSCRNTNVASVNAKGEVTAVAPGQTVVIARYGDQEVQCIVRCNF